MSFCSTLVLLSPFVPGAFASSLGSLSGSGSYVQPAYYDRRDLDIRDDTKQTAPRYIVFLSRPATVTPPSPGHAFVVWGFEDPARRLSGQDAWGYYPTEDAGKSVFRQVPGAIVDEFLKQGTGSADVQLSIRVSDKQYAAATSVLDIWKKKDHYKLREQDCVTFTGEIALSLALHVPDRGIWASKLPTTFVSDLASANTAATVLTGVWEYADERGRVRFRLQLDGARCIWIDNPPEGSQIQHSTDLIGSGPVFQLKRANSADVLLKLGYRDERTRKQIVDRNPGSSSLSIERSGQDLKGLWKGLIVTKESNNVDVKDIKFSNKEVVFRRVLK